MYVALHILWWAGWRVYQFRWDNARSLILLDICIFNSHYGDFCLFEISLPTPARRSEKREAGIKDLRDYPIPQSLDPSIPQLRD
jgi:hypothetical protein